MIEHCMSPSTVRSRAAFEPKSERLWPFERDLAIGLSATEAVESEPAAASVWSASPPSLIGLLGLVGERGGVAAAARRIARRWTEKTIAKYSSIAFRSAWFGNMRFSVSLDSDSPVMGLVFFCESQRSMCRLSYVWPSASTTGSCIHCPLIGQMKLFGCSSSCDSASRRPKRLVLEPEPTKESAAGMPTEVRTESPLPVSEVC
mmetsp:Transcript_73923/g.210982  ORF Transcript_73923/g.210982 Transcript_73923/m.210982 type:complete len:203 (-) Transcript_73923:160-768(-)